jgi:chitodextrinase
MADGSVDVPKVGKVNKKTLFPILAAAAAFIGYRYWKARQDAADVPVDPGYEDMSGGLGPGVTRPAGDYGLPDDSSSGATTGGFRGTTNSEWSEYVSDRLQQDGRWTYSVIAVALGNFLSDRPLTSDQQDIVRAAIGIAGQPPVGYHTLIPGGNTAITVAPTGVAGTGNGPAGMRVTFAGVAGAATYNVYLNGAVRGTGTGSPIDVAGLTPGTSYSVQVAAVSSSGQPGPKSSAVTVKTAGATLGKPSQPAISVNTGGGRVTFTTSGVPYATGYDWFLNGEIDNHTSAPACTFTGLKPKARYSPGVTVRATGSGKPGPLSTAKSFTTK